MTASRTAWLGPLCAAAPFARLAALLPLADLLASRPSIDTLLNVADLLAAAAAEKAAYGRLTLAAQLAALSGVLCDEAGRRGDETAAPAAPGRDAASPTAGGLSQCPGAAGRP